VSSFFFSLFLGRLVDQLNPQQIQLGSEVVRELDPIFLFIIKYLYFQRTLNPP